MVIIYVYAFFYCGSCVSPIQPIFPDFERIIVLAFLKFKTSTKTHYWLHFNFNAQSRRRRRRHSLFLSTLDLQSYERKYVLLQHNARKFATLWAYICNTTSQEGLLTLTILTQICFLSYITHQCHFAIYVHHPLHNNIYSFKLDLRDLLFLTMMLSQEKTLYEVVLPNCTTKLATNLPTSRYQLHNFNKISTTNRQQGSKPLMTSRSYSTINLTLTMRYIAPSRSYT